MGSQIGIAQCDADELEIVRFLEERLTIGVVPRAGVDAPRVDDFQTGSPRSLLIVPRIFAPDGLKGSDVFLKDMVAGNLAPRIGTYIEWDRSSKTSPSTFGVGRFYLDSKDREPEVTKLMNSLMRHIKGTYRQTVLKGVYVGPELAALVKDRKATIAFEHGAELVPVDV